MGGHQKRRECQACRRGKLRGKGTSRKDVTVRWQKTATQTEPPQVEGYKPFQATPNNSKPLLAEALWVQMQTSHLKLRETLARDEFLLCKPPAVTQPAAEDISPCFREQVPAPAPAAVPSAGSIPRPSEKSQMVMQLKDITCDMFALSKINRVDFAPPPISLSARYTLLWFTINAEISQTSLGHLLI